MPYDPRMLQMARMGVGMMANQPGPFDRNSPQPKQWWEQPQQSYSQLASQPADPSKPDDPNAPAPKKPPSMLDMMMGLGRMTRPEYDKAIAGQGGAAQGYGMVSPWAFLGSMGLPGGAGWGGPGVKG